MSNKTPAELGIAVTQRVLHLSESHFANSIDALISATGIGLWDWHLPSGTVIYSKQWGLVLGYSEEELSGEDRPWSERILPEDYRWADVALLEYLRGNTEQYEVKYRMRCKEGDIIWALEKGVITEWGEDGNPVRLVGVVQDITSIMQTEERLRKQSQRLDTLMHVTGLAMWSWNLEDDTLEYSDEYYDVLGYAPDGKESTPDQWFAFLHPDDADACRAAFEEMLRGDSDGYEQEVRIRHGDGRYLWMLNTGHVTRKGEDGRPLEILGGHLNIDRLKTTELRLAKSLEQNQQYSKGLQGEVDKALRGLQDSQRTYQAMLDANPYTCVILNDQFQPIDCNPAAVDFFAFADKQTLLDDAIALIAASIPERQPDGKVSLSLQDRFVAVMRDGQIEFETELRMHGELVPVNVIFKKINYEDSFAIVAYLLDLRSLREAKNDLIRQDRLLQAANNVAALLFAQDMERKDLNEKIAQSLRILGESVDADRAYVFRNSAGGDRLTTRQVGEWARPGQHSIIGSMPKDIAYDDFFPGWRETFARGEVMTTPDEAHLAGLFEAFPQLREIRSIVVVPIYSHGDFWGFIGFDICREETPGFSEEAHSILRSGGLLIASAIVREEMVHSLVEAREEALASTRAKSDFLSRMSHEIRTPMNAIIGMTTIAQKTEEMERVQYCLEKIEAASQQLLGLINDILDMSKIEANKLEIVDRPFDFERMMQDVFNIIRVRVEEKQQTFTFDFESPYTQYLISDEMRLSQVIVNLLSNAVKFTPEGGSIKLRVRQHIAQGDTAMLRIDVIDSGIGISAEQQKRLFTSFEQADGSITRRYGGTGLGLSICRSIAELMGGRIWVESEPEKGSTFRFEIPVTWGDPIVLPEAPVVPAEGLRILVVDDSEDVLIYFQNILAGYSLGCDVASGGEEGLRQVRQALEWGTPYDLVFLDWKMPGLDGTFIARGIKEIMQGNIIVVMISVADWTMIEPQAEDLGIARFLPKPILPSTLYNTIVELTQNTFVEKQKNPEEGMPDWRSKRLLLVEDIEINREILMSILEDTGISIDCAENGLEAVELFSQSQDGYDIVLMDVQMPELDGFGATRRIRASGLAGAQEVPIVAMTANAFKEDIENCLAAGMNDHIAKPISVDELLEKVERHMRKNRAAVE